MRARYTPKSSIPTRKPSRDRRPLSKDSLYSMLRRSVNHPSREAANADPKRSLLASVPVARAGFNAKIPVKNAHPSMKIVDEIRF